MDEGRPLEISEELARAERVPEDLDATQRGPYTIPSTRRRRLAAWVYLVGALGAGGMVASGFSADLLFTAGGLVVLAIWHFAGAWPIQILDPEALEAANRATGFPVGHASAVVGFDTWRARPVWNVLVFSADDPPRRRGLVRVDAVDGHVVEQYEEEVTSHQSPVTSQNRADG